MIWRIVLKRIFWVYGWLRFFSKTALISGRTKSRSKMKRREADRGFFCAKRSRIVALSESEGALPCMTPLIHLPELREERPHQAARARATGVHNDHPRGGGLPHDVPSSCPR